MKAKLIALHSPDIDDLYHYIPKDPDNFCFLVQIFVGIEGEEGEESFDVEVFTPQWLLSNHKKNEIVFYQHSIVVFEYKFDAIYGKIKDRIESCSGSSWDEVVLSIRKIGKWEFEDYRE